MDYLSSCPSLLEILSLLENEDHDSCRLMNSRLSDVIGRNHFNTKRARCIKLSITFCKSNCSEDIVSFTIRSDSTTSRRIRITDRHIESCDTSGIGNQKTNTVTLTGGIVEGIQKLVPRLATRYQFITMSINPCPYEEWARAFRDLPNYHWLQCNELTVGEFENNIISNAITAHSIHLHDPINMERFMERNEIWDRMIWARSVSCQPKISFQNLLELIKKWHSGDCDRLLYFSIELYESALDPYHQVIASLQSIPAFYIGIHEYYSYVKAYIRRERNSMSFEEGTESVLCFECKGNEYLFREINYSGPFDIFPVEEIELDRHPLHYSVFGREYKPSMVYM